MSPLMEETKAANSVLLVSGKIQLSSKNAILRS